jgi:hypothetical protein
MTTQRHEIEAWLGDDHRLTDQQIDELVGTADDIAIRYPDPDDRDEREAALTVAYRLLTGDTAVVDELARELSNARQTQVRALAGLRQATLDLVPTGRETEAGIARRAGVDRMAVRGWLGKR